MISYQFHLFKVAQLVSDKIKKAFNEIELKNQGRIELSPLGEDDDLNTEILYSECIDYCNKNDLAINGCLTSDAASFIAGYSASIEFSYDGRYRKDSWRDVVWGAFLYDVQCKVKEKNPNWRFNNTCERSR